MFPYGPTGLAGPPLKWMGFPACLSGHKGSCSVASRWPTVTGQPKRSGTESAQEILIKCGWSIESKGSPEWEKRFANLLPDIRINIQMFRELKFNNK